MAPPTAPAGGGLPKCPRLGASASPMPMRQSTTQHLAAQQSPRAQPQILSSCTLTTASPARHHLPLHETTTAVLPLAAAVSDLTLGPSRDHHAAHAAVAPRQLPIGKSSEEQQQFATPLPLRPAVSTPGSLASANPTANWSHGCLFEMDLELDADAPWDGEQALDPEVQALVSDAMAITAPVDAFAEALASATAVLKSNCRPSSALGYAVDPEALGHLLSSRGFSSAVTTTDPQADPKPVPLLQPHTFLSVSPRIGQREQQATQPMYVVDPNFKDQFRVAAVLSHHVYAPLLATLPEIFVGTPQQLIDFVRFLSKQMQRAFLELDVSVPPWRSTPSYLSRWISQGSDITDTACHVAPRRLQFAF